MHVKKEVLPALLDRVKSCSQLSSVDGFAVTVLAGACAGRPGGPYPSVFSLLRVVDRCLGLRNARKPVNLLGGYPGGFPVKCRVGTKHSFPRH